MEAIPPLVHHNDCALILQRAVQRSLIHLPRIHNHHKFRYPFAGPRGRQNAMLNANVISIQASSSYKHHRLRLTENLRTITSRMVYFSNAAAMPPWRIASSKIAGDGTST